MAVSHKNLELPNSRIWLAEIGIESSLSHLERHLDRYCFGMKKLQAKMQILAIFFEQCLFIKG